MSALVQPVSDSVMIARLSQSVGGGFHTAVGEAPKQTARNTIKACVHGGPDHHERSERARAAQALGGDACRKVCTATQHPHHG